MTVNDDVNFGTGTEDDIAPRETVASKDHDLLDSLSHDDDLALGFHPDINQDNSPPSPWITRGRRIRFWCQIAALLFLGCFLIGWPLGTSLAELNKTGIFRFHLGLTLDVFFYMTTIPILIFIIGQVLAIACRMAAKAEELELSAEKLMVPETPVANVQSIGAAVRGHIETFNIHLDEALNKLASVESMIRQQIKAIDSAADTMQDISGASVQRVADERQQLIELTENLNREADDFAEAIAEKAKLGLESSESANARIAGAERELENKLARLENTSQKALTAFDNLAAAIDEKEAAVSESSARLDLIRSETSRKTDDITSLMAENADAISTAQQKLEEESDRLENLIKDQRDRADKLADAISEQAERLGQISFTAESQLSAPAIAQPREHKPLSLTNIEPEVKAVSTPQTEAPKKPLKHLKIEDDDSEKQDVRKTRFAKSWSDILAAADEPEEPLTLGAEDSVAAISEEKREPAQTPTSGNSNVINLVRDMQQFMLELERQLYGAPQSAVLARFDGGERNIFANIILHREEQDIKNRIRLESARNENFQKSVYGFLASFDKLLEPATGEHDSDNLIDDYLGSPIGQVYLIVGSAMDYFS